MADQKYNPPFAPDTQAFPNAVRFLVMRSCYDGQQHIQRRSLIFSLRSISSWTIHRGIDLSVPPRNIVGIFSSPSLRSLFSTVSAHRRIQETGIYSDREVTNSQYLSLPSLMDPCHDGLRALFYGPFLQHDETSD
jgi:hypothetical protein